MESDGFYVTLCSNNNNDLFENSYSRFRNLLFQPIQLSQDHCYECALVYLSFKCKTNQENPLKITLFGLSSNEKVIAYIPTEQKYELLMSRWYFVGSLSQRFYAEVRNAGTHLKFVSFTQNYDLQGKFRIGFEVNLPENYVLAFDATLAKILGVNELYDTNGKYEGLHIISEEKLEHNRFALTRVKISIIKYTKKEVDVSLEEDDTLDAVAEAFNTAFTDNDIEANITFGDTEGAITVKQQNLKIELPPAFNAGVLVPNNFQYKTGTHKLFLHHLESRKTREHILLLADFVAEQFYCSSLLPLVKVLPVESLSKSSVSFPNPQYISVCKKYITDIQITLVDQNLEEIKLKEEPSPITAVFHFRKRK